MDKETLRREAEGLRNLYQQLRSRLAEVIVGQEEPLHFLALSLFGGGMRS